MMQDIHNHNDLKPMLSSIMDFIGQKQDVVVILDVDDTLITPRFPVGNLIDSLKAEIKNQPNSAKSILLQNAVNSWRLNRTIKLVNDGWLNAFAKLKERASVFGLTKLNLDIVDKDKGLTIQQWRYEELKGLGFEFHDLECFDNFKIDDAISDCSDAIHHRGIFFTGRNSKNDVMEEVIKVLNKNRLIVFIDDKRSNVEDFAQFASKHGIESYIVHYTEAEVSNVLNCDKQLFDECINKLKNYGVWNEDKLLIKQMVMS